MLSSFPLDVSLLATDLAAEIIDLRSCGVPTDIYGLPGPTGLIQLKTNQTAQP